MEAIPQCIVFIQILKEGEGGPAKSFLIPWIHMVSSKRTYGVLQEHIWWVARAHMLCCKSTYSPSRPEQASQWANRDNEYTKMNLSARSTILDGSQEPVIVPNDGI